MLRLRVSKITREKKQKRPDNIKPAKRFYSYKETVHIKKTELLRVQKYA